MLSSADRQEYVFLTLDTELNNMGPETFIGVTAYNLASGLWHNDPTLPVEIKNTEEMESDCKAWLDLHPELLTADRVVEIREDGSAVWDQDAMRRIERALSTGPGTMLADACAKLKRS